MVTKDQSIAAEFYQTYIQAAKEQEPLKSLKKNSKDFKDFIKKIPAKKHNYAYAEGKWTIKELIQHLIDTERVFAYRALRFARKDATPLASFDENAWAANAKVGDRKWDDLIKEFRAVRKSTEMMFESFDDEALLSSGTASNHPINVVALGFIAAGHVAHHCRIIKERYL
ncbi:MAG: DinB family protein [Bacteroidetes bacterium]|nr:DinB family protein [Bacteroidota bacterium]